MTTPEQLIGQASPATTPATLPEAASLESDSAALSGAPDPAWISQLANAYFNAVPGEPVPEPSASQPSISAADVSPRLPANPGAPVIDAPFSPSEASQAPFQVPTPASGASQPSAPVYAHETERPGQYLPPSSPSGSAWPVAPVQTFEPARPSAYLPPSSPSGARLPATPVLGYEAGSPGSYLPPSSPCGTTGPAAPVYATEPARAGSAPAASSVGGFTYAPFWPLHSSAPNAPATDPNSIPINFPQGDFAHWPAVVDFEPSWNPAAGPSGGFPVRRNDGQPRGVSSSRAPGTPHYAGGGYPSGGGGPGPNTQAPAAHGAGAPHYVAGGPHPFGTAPGPNTAPPHHRLETSHDVPDHGTHPFGTAPGPNTTVPAPSAVDSDDPHHPHNGRSWNGGVPNQTDLAGPPSHSGGVVSAVPLFDGEHGPFHHGDARPQGGAPAGDSYYFLDRGRRAPAPESTNAPSPPQGRSASGERRNGTTGNIPTPPISGKRAFIPEVFRRDFPILDQEINGRPLVWLDNAATTQKPRAVIDRIAHFYTHENSNVHRAAHTLAARSTEAFEQAREKVRRFINAPSVKNIVFVRGTTEGINLVSQAWGRRNVGPGDEVVITHLEHHSNIVPWQLLCAEKGAVLRVAPVDDHGEVILDQYEKLLNPRTRIVSFTQVSNALGTVTPVREMVAMAHRHGARVVLSSTVGSEAWNSRDLKSRPH